MTRRGDERALAPAEAELRMYYGGGSSAASGNPGGLRSTLGYQLEAMQTGLSASPTVDGDSAERHMVMSIAATRGRSQVEAALLQIDENETRAATLRAVLRLAFGGRDLRPGISHVIVVTAEARRAAEAQLGRTPSEGDVAQVALEADARAPWLKRAQAAAQVQQDAALAAYATARFLVLSAPKSSRREVPHEFFQWRDTPRREPSR